MGLHGFPGIRFGSTTGESKTCDTAAGRRQWFLLIVRSKQERKVADGLLAKGYEVFLPMHTVRRQWSDRLKTYEAPLFPGHLFCRFSLILENKDLMVLKTPGVVLIHFGGGKPLPIPDLEVERLRRIAASQYPVECCAPPQTGEIVEILGDLPIRGVLVERGSVCRVAIGFDAMGRTVVLRIPLADLDHIEGQLTPHWSLRTL
jgi:hypothetical protein